MLEQFPQPLAAALSHDARVPPTAWGARGGPGEGEGLRGLGEGLGTRRDLGTVVTAWLLALHRFALPSIRALVTSECMSIAEKHAWVRRRVCVYGQRCGHWHTTLAVQRPRGPYHPAL